MKIPGEKKAKTESLLLGLSQSIFLKESSGLQYYFKVKGGGRTTTHQLNDIYFFSPTPS
jgi:hypothetical protein